MQDLVSQARKAGADAVLCFRMEYGSGGGGFMVVVVPGDDNIKISGAAVRMKRP